MAVTAASLKVNHPEFDNSALPDAVITAFIAQATLLHCEEVWGDDFDFGVEWKTCHLLALSPYGRSLKLVQDKKKTIYGDEWTRREKQVGTAWRLLP